MPRRRKDIFGMGAALGFDGEREEQRVDPRRSPARPGPVDEPGLPLCEENVVRAYVEMHERCALGCIPRGRLENCELVEMLERPRVRTRERPVLELPPPSPRRDVVARTTDLEGRRRQTIEQPIHRS